MNTAKGLKPNDAVFSPDRTYRYLLSRRLTDPQPNLFDGGPIGGDHKTMLFVMLNPSTGDEWLNDPTVARCVSRAKEYGMEDLWVVNVYGFRSTNPKALKDTRDPIGQENDAYIAKAASLSSMIVVAWGALCPKDREDAVLGILRGQNKKMLWCLGTTKDGHPRHPLYIRASQKLMPF